MSFAPDKVIKAVLRDCKEDFFMSDLPVGPVSTYLLTNEHFTEEENAICHRTDVDPEENMKAFVDILLTKNDECLDGLIDYLDKKNQMHPHLVRVLVASRTRRRIKPDDDDDGDKDDLAPGDFRLTLGGVEIIRNLIMSSPTSKGKWLDISVYIIKSDYHINKLKSVNAGRPEKMIDMSFEFWIGGAESDHRPTFDTLVKILEDKKMKKLAEQMLKIKQKLCNACQVPVTGGEEKK